VRKIIVCRIDLLRKVDAAPSFAWLITKLPSASQIDSTTLLLGARESNNIVVCLIQEIKIFNSFAIDLLATLLLLLSRISLHCYLAQEIPTHRSTISYKKIKLFNTSSGVGTISPSRTAANLAFGLCSNRTEFHTRSTVRFQ